MTFWDTLGAVAKVTANMTLNPIGTAWGIASGSKDLSQAKNVGEVFNTLSSVQPKSVAGSLGVPGADLSPADALSKPLEYGVARPLSTWNMVNTMDDQNQGSIFDASTWQKAWNQSAEIGPGQSTLIGIGAKPGDVNLNNDPGAVQARKDFFYNTWYGRTSSGLLDGLVDWFADPLVVGSKVAKGLEVGQAVAKPKDVPNAIALLRGDITSAEGVTKAQTTVADKMGKFIGGTDNMNFDQLMTHPVIAKSPDAGGVATLFDEANKIPDATQRFQTKADILGVLQGNAASIDRMTSRQDALGSEISRFLQPAEGANHTSMFRINDHGEQEIVAINGPDQEKEILARQDQIEQESQRLSRLMEQQGSNRTVQGSLSANLGFNLRQDRLRETLLVSGQGSRPIRMIYGSLGARVPGHIDTLDASNGYEDLANMLSRDKWMAPDTRLGLLADFGKATSKEERFQVATTAENMMFKAAGEQTGLKPEEIKALYNSTTGVRGKWRAALTDRAYSGKTPTIIGPDGEAYAYGPFVGPMIQSTVPFTDPAALDWALKKHTQTRWIETLAKNYAPMSGPALNDLQAARLNNAAEATWDGMNQFLGTLMRPWKFAALFRIAYPQRIQVDSQLRNLSVLGPIQYFASAKQGTVDFLRNHTDLAVNPEWDALRLDAESQAKDLTKNVQQTQRMRSNPEYQQARLAELDRQAAELQDRMDAVPRFVKKGKTLEAASLLKQPETYKGVDITPARNADEFALMQRQLDTDGTLSRLMSDHSSAQVDAARKSPGWTIIPGSDPNWESSMLGAVNHQFRNSPTFRAALELDDEGKLTNWIRQNPKEWKMFRNNWDTPEEYAHMIMGQADHYLPSDSLKAIARDRDLTMADIKTYYPPGTLRPDIHGPRYRDGWPDDPNAPGNAMKRFSNWWYKWASDVPEQVMARHPLFNQRFRDHLKDQIDSFDGASITTQGVNQMRVNAAKLARKDVADVLFDLTRQSGASDTFRLFSPFFSAWEDTMVKWGKLFLDNPQQAVHAVQVWNSPNGANLVYDSEGYLVKNGQAYDANTGQAVPAEKRGKGEYMVLPNFLGYAGVGNKDWSLKIPKSSFNIVFQGDPAWLPGAGPLVEVPVNELAKHTALAGQVASNPVLSYLLPYGITDQNPVEQLLPSWARQLANSRPTTQAYAQQYAIFAAAEDSKWRTGDRKNRPSGEEIAGMVNNYFLMRAVLSNAAPVTVEPGISPKLQFYVDQFHQMRNDYYKNPEVYKAANDGKDWEQVAYDKFPDYFALSVDLSSNTTGIVASDQAFNAGQKYAKYIAPHPEYGWAIVGTDNQGAFDPNVRNAELANSIGYGQSSSWRKNQNPIDAAQKIEAERGFLKYNSFMTGLNLLVEKRDPTGVKTIRSKDNQDLAALKDQFVQSLANENRPWAAAYGSQDQHATDVFVGTMLDAIRDNKEIAARPDMVALKMYMTARDAVTQILKKRGQTGSSSLTNPANQDISDLWGAIGRTLVSGNVGFERMYNRVLERDDPSKGLIGIGDSASSDPNAVS